MNKKSDRSEPMTSSPHESDSHYWTVEDDVQIEDLQPEEGMDKRVLVWRDNPYCDEQFADMAFYRIVKWHVTNTTVEEVAEGLDLSARGIWIDAPGSKSEYSDELYYEMCQGTIYVIRHIYDENFLPSHLTTTAICDVELIEAGYRTRCEHDIRPLQKKTRRMVDHLCSHDTRKHVTPNDQASESTE